MKFLIIAALASSAAATFIDSARCCNELKNSGLGGKVSFPANASYDASVESYWSITAQLTPSCVVLPTTAQDVSLAVRTLVRAHRAGPCLFAVRSGGHTPWPGAANIKNGITIDLSLLNQTVYNAEKSIASVGPGARWDSVYAELDKFKVSVPGSRSPRVGVGGLILGGGNSFFTARYGFVCDNVANFEIVLGDGRIVNANQTSNADLWQALKGGGNNLGIVTRFDLVAFAQGDLWGGLVAYPESTTAHQIKAFVNFGNNIVKDVFGSLISFWQYTSESDTTVVINAYHYTKPVVDAPPYKEHLAIPGKISDSTRISNVSDLAGEIVQAYGFRNIFWTVTFANDARVLQEAILALNCSIDLAKQRAVGEYRLLHIFQPIPALFSKLSQERGGNILGLERFPENLILFQADLTWSDSADDALIDEIGQRTISRISRFAQKMGKANEFIYLDYAYATQNPLASYGDRNLRKLREVARKYDPGAVFQTMVPGGFKLDAAGPG